MTESAIKAVAVTFKSKLILTIDKLLEILLKQQMTEIIQLKNGM